VKLPPRKSSVPRGRESLQLEPKREGGKEGEREVGWEGDREGVSERVSESVSQGGREGEEGVLLNLPKPIPRACATVVSHDTCLNLTHA
jgi:hypothetical protein